MASQSWGQLIATIPTAGTLYNTFTTAKSMLSSATATEAAAGVLTTPANFFQRGGIIEVDFNAGMSWATGNTITFQVNVGAVIAFTSDAIKVTTTGGTTEPVSGSIRLTCRSQGNGTLGTLIGGGWVQGRGIAPPGSTPGANYSAGMGFSSMKEGTPAVGTGFDTTIANTIDFLVAMGTSSASNGFQLQEYAVKSWGCTGV